MVTYIEYSDRSLLLQWLSQKYGFDFLDVLSGKVPCPIESLGISNFAELYNYLEADLGLFDFDGTGSSQYLVDIKELALDADNLARIKSLSENSDLDIILHTTDGAIKADTKKILAKLEIPTLQFKKPDQEILSSIAQKYIDENSMGITVQELGNAVTTCENYNELLNNLDFVFLANNKKEAIKSLVKSEKLALFMRGFGINNLEKDTRTWAKEVDENDLQLALSLIYGKLDKLDTHKSKQLQKELILTDQRIKTRSKISGLVWFKMFLYRCRI
jgi:hypothetical protein